MSDPLLTSLCGICHIKTPKYKCPGCNVRTCSLPCVRKHKKWSSCSGERDPTVYMPANKLRTDAGIDHDYNFLTKIERTVERVVEKTFIEERGILPPRETSPPQEKQPNKKRRMFKGQSRGRTTIGGGSHEWGRQAIRKLSLLDIHVMHVPFGMVRGKENNTTYNKRTDGINWQVEWLVLDPAKSVEDGKTCCPERLLHKTLDQTPIYAGFAECREEQRRLQMNKAEKRKELRHAKKEQDNQEVLADETAGNDMHSELVSQDPDSTGARQENGPTDRRKYREKLAEEVKQKYKFFYQIPNTPSREPHKLIPVEATDTLANVLSGMKVLEFPTIYVLPSASTLQEGYVLEKKPARPSNPPRKEQQKENDQTKSKKRKDSMLVEYGSSHDEEGEVHEGLRANNEDGNSKGEVEDDDSSTSSSGTDSSSDSDSD